jgi:hypothetical protein
MVDCLEFREELPLVALALGDRLRRKVGPAVIVAGNTDVGRKLRERIQLPIPDLVEEFVEAFLLTRNRFRGACAGSQASDSQADCEREPVAHFRLLSNSPNIRPRDPEAPSLPARSPASRIWVGDFSPAIRE